jgi:tetratricopeptide (TPR) repeat protein
MFSRFLSFALPALLVAPVAGAQNVPSSGPARVPPVSHLRELAALGPVLTDLRLDVESVAGSVRALDVNALALDASAVSVWGVEAAKAQEEALRAYEDVVQKVVKDRVVVKVPPGVRADVETVEYDRATRLLDRGQYDQAVTAFERVAERGGRRTEGALYWQAYALNRLGRRADAIARLDELLKKYPSSRWANDAKALQLDARQASGQVVSPEKTEDEELKAMALRSLMMHDPERAVPMLENVLKGSSSPKVKEQALFVLAQSGSPQAREILGRMARGGSNPDVQLKAVRYLAMFGGQESRQVLSDVYAQNSDLDVKRQVLQAFMLSGDRERLLTAARSETAPELRAEAVRQLGIMGARAELGELYRNEASAKVKEQLLQALFISGASDKLLEVAKTEGDAALRKSAVRNLGLMDSKKTGEALLQFYRDDKDPTVKRAAIQGLFLQQNAGALVSLARQEKDPEMRKEIVSKLSLMKSKEAQDYMLELLK